MSRKRVKARDKVALKMSRDGAIERNAASGEDARISKRTVDFDLRGEQAESFSQVGKSGKSNHKRKQRNRPNPAENGAAGAIAEPQIANEKSDTPKQPENAVIPQPFITAEQQEIRQDEYVAPTDNSVLPQITPGNKSKPPPKQSRQYATIAEQSDVLPLQPTKPQPPKSETAKLQTDSPIEDVTEQPEPTPQSALKHDKQESALKTEQSSELKFSRDETPPKLSRKQKKKRRNRANTHPSQAAPTQKTDIADAPQQLITREFSPPPIIPNADIPSAQPENTLQPPSKLNTEPNTQLHTEQRSELKFTKDERTAPPKGKQNQSKAQISEQKSPVWANTPTNNANDVPIVAPLNAADVADFAPIPIPIKPFSFKDSDISTSAEVTQSDGVTPPLNSDTKPFSADVTDAPQSAPDNKPVADIEQSESVTPPQKSDAPESALKPDKSGKLQFTEDETPPAPPSRAEVKQQKRYGKAQTQADKSVKKLETAKSKLPAKKKLRSERVFNEETGKAKKKLYFENEVKSQSEHLKGAMPLRPAKAAGNTALAFTHRKIYQVERENVATEAAHKGEIAAEGIVRSALRHHKTAPYQKVAKLERTAQKKTVNAAYQKALAENPKLQSNALSRAFQKRKIKKDYAKAAREAEKTAKRAKQAGSAVGNATKALAGVVKRHPVATAAIVLIALLLFMLMSLIGAFGSAGSGGLSGLLSVSYLAEDADIDNAELVYTEWETDLQIQIANTESTHPGYDEYRYNIGDISHNPYELMAYLTAKYQNFTYAAIQADLQTLFNEQYQLTFTPTTETRYADPTDADNDGDYEPYYWNVMTVTLTARNFTDVITTHLGGEFEHYALLMQTKGSRQYLSNPFGDMNWLPYVTSYYGYRIHPISGVKNYHKGVDIGLPLGTEIHAGQDGTVTFAGYSGDYGNVIVIENADGLVSKYAHCDTLSVTAGQIVKTNDVIATVGSTGNSTGAHLHLEVLKNNVYINPIYFTDTGSFTAAPTYGYAGEPLGDGSYAALMEVALRFEGFPYVFGGSSPETSFDCSGLVSYCLRVSGVKDVGRLGATGLYNVCNPVSPSEAMPGDLVFFHSTYSTTNPISHVGIYCGNNIMYDAGNPIGYTRIDTSYWQSHFYGFGRIPTE